MYLSRTTYEAIRDDPSKVVDYYNATRSTFIRDLAMPGLSEGALKAAWCTVVAYGLVPYGRGPATTELEQLLEAKTIACAHYVSLTWRLLEQFGLPADNLTAVGWDGGAVGNHAQLLYSDGNTKLLLDPTIALVVKGVTFEGLIAGAAYKSMKSFFSRSEIEDFNAKVITAIRSGSYEVQDTIYRIPGLDNWVEQRADFRGVTIERGGGAQIIVGYLTADSIDAGAGNDIVYGGKGDDTLDGGLGADRLYGGLGNDRFHVDHSSDRVIEQAGQGVDTVLQTLSRYVLPANVENVSILRAGQADVTGNALPNMIHAGTGNNVIKGGAGLDMVNYYNSDAAVTVKLSVAARQFTGGSGSDALQSIEHLAGSNFSDLLMGNSAGNRIYGFSGDDAINGLGGADSMFGGTGSDRYYVDHAGDRVVEESAAAVGGVDTVFSRLAAYVLPSNVENGVILATGGASLTGNSLANVLQSGRGGDLLNGGGGLDTASYAGAGSAVKVDLALSGRQKTGGSGSDALVSIENLVGSRFGDVLLGSAGGNVLTGGAGADELYGRAGNDVLIGGAGADILWGGSGSDRFVFDHLPQDGTVDVLRDFDAGFDRVELDGAVFSALADRFGSLSGAVAGLGDADAVLLYDAGSGALYYDPTGAVNDHADAVQFAVLPTHLALTYEHFTLF